MVVQQVAHPTVPASTSKLHCVQELDAAIALLVDALDRFGSVDEELGFEHANNIFWGSTRDWHRRQELIAASPAANSTTTIFSPPPQTTAAETGGGQPGAIVSAQEPSSKILTQPPNAANIMMSALASSVVSIQSSINAMQVGWAGD